MVDVIIENHGSIFMVTPMNDEAMEWFDDNVASDPWQWMGTSLGVDHGQVANLVQDLIDEGFIVE